MRIDPARYRVEPEKRLRLGKLPARAEPYYESKADYERALARQIAELSALQGRLYADDRYALLLIFQAMDAAGKDGVIKHVMSGVNPQGCQVFSFKHRARSSSTTIFSGAPPSRCRSGGASASSTGPITRRC